MYMYTNAMYLLYQVMGILHEVLYYTGDEHKLWHLVALRMVHCLYVLVKRSLWDVVYAISSSSLTEVLLKQHE